MIDKELKKETERAEAAFRENNSLPDLNDSSIKNPVNVASHPYPKQPQNSSYAVVPYVDNEQLIRDVSFKYQTATNLFILNPSTLDADGVPAMQVKKLREVKLSYGYTQNYYRGKPTYQNNRHNTVDAQLIFAYVKGDRAYLKSMKLHGEEYL